MFNTKKLLVVLGLAAGAVCTGAIIQAVIPQVVPTANKRGTATIFALANSTTPGSTGATVCDDGTGAFGTSGCTGGTPAIFSQTNTITDAVQTTETSLTGTGSGSTALAANTFAVGTALNFYVSGFYSTTGSPGTLDLKLKTAGGTTGTVVLGDTGTITPISSVTNGVWRFWGTITCRTTGTGGTLILNTTLEMGPSSTSTLTPAVASVKNTTAVTVDTTATQTIDVTAAWSAASQSISSTNYVLASIGAAGGGGGSGTVNTGTQFQVGEYLTAGSAISGVSIPNCPDTSGNHVNFASGTGVFTCGTTSSGGGSGNPWVFPNSPTAVNQGSFSNLNMGSCAETVPQTGRILLTSNAANAQNVCGRSIAFPAGAFTRTFGIYLQFVGSASAAFGNGGVFFSDGTRVTECGIFFQSTTAQPQWYSVGAAKLATVTSAPTFYTSTNTLAQGQALQFLQLADDGAGNLSCSYSPDGTSFATQVFTDKDTTGAGGFLTPTLIGYYVNTGQSNVIVRMTVISFTNP